MLGVEEYPDRSLHIVDLPDPEWMIRDMLDILNDPKRVSMNILRKKDISVRKVGGKRIIMIKVPRADRSCKPVYIGGDPYSGTYRRNGDGDYKCSREEVEALINESRCYDPVEDTDEYRSVVEEADIAAQAELESTSHARRDSEDGIYFSWCYAFWEIKKRILKEKYNIDWRTPAELSSAVRQEEKQ